MWRTKARSDKRRATCSPVFSKGSHTHNCCCQTEWMNTHMNSFSHTQTHHRLILKWIHLFSHQFTNTAAQWQSILFRRFTEHVVKAPFGSNDSVLQAWHTFVLEVSPIILGRIAEAQPGWMGRVGAHRCSVGFRSGLWAGPLEDLHRVFLKPLLCFLLGRLTAVPNDEAIAFNAAEAFALSLWRIACRLMTKKIWFESIFRWVGNTTKSGKFLHALYNCP